MALCGPNRPAARHWTGPVRLVDSAASESGKPKMTTDGPRAPGHARIGMYTLLPLLWHSAVYAECHQHSWAAYARRYLSSVRTDQ